MSAAARNPIVEAPAAGADEGVRIVDVEILADDHYTLRKYTFDLQLSDGRWQRQVREAYDRGDGAAILLYDPRRRTVVLTRQFRLPAFVNGASGGKLIEAPAGLLDERAPEEAIRREVEEETGFVIGTPVQVHDVFMSPGAVTERLHLFIAEYDPAGRSSAGGGLVAEGEDIEVIELPFEDALAKVASGEIRDAKTILLLYHARVAGIL